MQKITAMNPEKNYHEPAKIKPIIASAETNPQSDNFHVAESKENKSTYDYTSHFFDETSMFKFNHIATQRHLNINQLLRNAFSNQQK